MNASTKRKYLFAVLALSSSTMAAPNNQYNFDQPKQVIKQTLGNSAGSEEKITQTCYIYNDYAILEVNDPNNMGAAKVTVRPNNPSITNNTICNPDTKIKGYEIKQDGYFKGKFNHFVYFDGPDAFGNIIPFNIYKLHENNATLLIHSATELNKKFTFTKALDNNIDINYWMGLENKSRCSIADNHKEKCWKKLLTDNNIKQPLPIPNCTESYKKGNSPLDNYSLVLLHVQIQNLDHPDNIKVINNKSICNPAP